MANDLAVIEKANSLREFIYRPNVTKQLEAALPKFLTPDRFLRTFYTAMMRNPALMDCSKESILSTMIVSAQLGLEPIMNKAALVPYGKECQFQPMYGGIIDLARRTMNIVISAHVVHENDDFEYEYGLNETLRHVPAKQDRGNPIGAYTVWVFESGMKSFLYMPASDIYEIRDKYSKAYQYAKANPKNEKAQQTPWITRPGEMMKKTVIKQHAKLQPCSIEMEQALDMDSTTELGNSQIGAAALFGFGVAVPKGAEEDKFGELVSKYDPEKVKAFLALLVDQYAGKYSEEDLKAEAVNKPDSFIQGLDDYIAKNMTLKDEIGRLKAVGLKDWEKANHDKIVGSLFSGTKQISDDDLNFFLDKWRKVIGFDYTIEGQAGFVKKEEAAKPPQEEKILKCPKDGADVELTFCNGICKTREGCPAHG
jgi:recombination protein RecT